MASVMMLGNLYGGVLGLGLIIMLGAAFYSSLIGAVIGGFVALLGFGGIALQKLRPGR
jgi:hypothetical protein